MATIKASNRERVLQAYDSAISINRNLFIKGDASATSEYIFNNQKTDANNIVNDYYENNRRIISVQKKTKVGMNGLMVEVAKLMTTHPDDDFIVDFENVRIITGMSNAGWEKEMKEKSPECFKDKIFHHNQLKKAELNNLVNALIIIDEIDSGDKEGQKLHNALKDAGILNINHIIKNNNRIMVVSATYFKELYHLYRWGDLHNTYKMTVPNNYIGHYDFLEKGIIKEFYPIDKKSIKKWINEDIFNNYGKDDYRVHIIRVTNETIGIIQDECIMNENSEHIIFRNHTSEDRISPEEIKELFEEPLKKHHILAVKGFLRRANLIPNKYKLNNLFQYSLYI
jgi:hypothetical protein